jgi:DNA polymerase-3 subunit delta'
MSEEAGGLLRPVLGHHEARTQLAAALASGRMPHAWLFSGPRGVGKASLAVQFAARLLGAAPTAPFACDDVDPVGRLVAAQSHPDFRLLRRPVDDKGKEKSEIPVALVREEVIDFFQLRPAMGGWRVAVVDAVDELNRNGANALLKTLEEPPPQSVLILVSHGEKPLLPTVRSRCRGLAFKPLGDDDAVAALAARGIGADAAREALGLAPGRPGRALALAEPAALAAAQAAAGVLGARARADALAAALREGGKGEPAYASAVGALAGDLARRAAASADPLEAADFAARWLTLARIDAEARELSMDSVQTLARVFAAVRAAAPVEAGR